MPLFKCGRRLGLSPFRLAFPVMLTRLPHSDSGFSPMLVLTIHMPLMFKTTTGFAVHSGFCVCFYICCSEVISFKKKKTNSLNFVRLGKIKQVLAVFI